MEHRKEKISSVLRKELNQFLLREVELPADVVTITGVEVAADLGRAVVKFSVLPSEKAVEVWEALKKEQPRIQHFLLQRMRMRRPPTVIFEIDRGSEQAAQIEKLLLAEEKEVDKGGKE